MLTLPLAGGDDKVRVLIRRKEVRYIVERDGEAVAASLADDYVDRGVYSLLAELAGRA
jgi:hypothetical protein